MTGLIESDRYEYKLQTHADPLYSTALVLSAASGPLAALLECLRFSTRTVFETEYDVISNLFQIRKLCLRFLIYVMLENFRIDNQHGLCAEKC
jgi:hypothetical protein